MDSRKKDLRDIIAIKPLFNIIMKFAGPNIRILTNGYKTCFNGFEFKEADKKIPKIISFRQESIANIHIWLENLLVNFPKIATINGEECQVPIEVKNFGIHCSIKYGVDNYTQMERRRSIVIDIKENNLRYLNYINRKAEFDIKSFENNSINRQNVIESLSIFISDHFQRPEDVEFYVRLEFMNDNEDDEDLNDIIPVPIIVSFPSNSIFKSHLKWYITEDLEEVKTPRVINSKIINFLPKTLEEYRWIPHINMIPKFNSKVDPYRYQGSDCELKTVESKLMKNIELYNEILKKYDDFKNDFTFLNSLFSKKNGLFGTSSGLFGTSSGLFKYSKNKDIMTKLFNGNPPICDYFEIIISSCYRRGTYAPYLSATPREVLTFKLFFKSNAKKECENKREIFDSRLLFINEIKPNKYKKIAKKIYSELNEYLKKKEEMFGNLIKKASELFDKDTLKKAYGGEYYEYNGKVVEFQDRCENCDICEYL